MTHFNAAKIVLKVLVMMSKLMTNNTQGIGTEVKVNGQKLETVTSFNYLESIITDEDSKTKILTRIAQTTAALTNPYGMSVTSMSVRK